jgi:diacylglycerol kinase (ATP)
VRITLIHCPAAGKGSHDADGLIALLAEAGHEVGYRSTEDEDWRDALCGPSDLVVAAGGDGTVRRVFTALPGHGLRASLLPLGSANNIARTLGVEGAELADLIRRWDVARSVPFDIGEVDIGDRTTRFVEAVGSGLFAEVLRRARMRPHAHGEQKRRRGLKLLLEALCDASAHDWRITLDGQDLSGAYLGVEAMNLRQIGPSLPLAPVADPGDGLMDLVCVRPEDRGAMVEWIHALREGAPGARPPLPVARGSTLRLGVPDGERAHVDDGLVAAGPCTLDVRLGAIRLDLLIPGDDEGR